MNASEPNPFAAGHAGKRARILQLARFAMAGFLATAAHYIVMFTGLWLTAGPVFWSFTGATVGGLVGYLVNYFITFESNVPHKQALSRYVTIVLLSLGLNTLTLFVLLQATDMRVLFAQIITTVVVFVVNYLAHSSITFKG